MDHALALDPEELAEWAEPLLERWVRSIWAVCVQATGEATPTRDREPLQQALLAAIGGVACETEERALDFARGLMSATAVEPDQEIRAKLAERIGRLRERHDTAEIALMEAMALWNAAFREEGAERRVALADRIGAVRECHDTAEIAVWEATALAWASRKKTAARWELAMKYNLGEG